MKAGDPEKTWCRRPELGFLVQSIDHAGTMLASEEWLFYDSDLTLIERRDLATTEFDTRQRVWYTDAMAAEEAITTGFYVFYTTRETGLTVARQVTGGGAAVGADLALRDLEAALAQQKVTPSTRIAVLDPNGGVIALSETREEIPLVVDEGNARIDMPHIGELQDPVYSYLGKRFEAGVFTGRESVKISGRDWLLSVSTMSANPERDVYLAVLIPRDELLATINRVRINGTLISLGLLVGAVVLVVWISRNISKSLGSLALEAEMVREFRFDTPIKVRSRVREVGDLAETMALMKSSIQQFLDISQALSAEKDLHRVLELVLKEAMKVSQAGGGAVLMMSEDHKSLEVALMADGATDTFQDGTLDGATVFEPVELAPATAPAALPAVDWQSAQEGMVVRIDDVDRETDHDTAAVRARYDSDSFQTRSLLSVPLQNQLDEGHWCAAARQGGRCQQRADRISSRDHALHRSSFLGCSRGPRSATSTQGAEGSAGFPDPHDRRRDRCQIALHPWTLSTSTGGSADVGRGRPCGNGRFFWRVQSERERLVPAPSGQLAARLRQADDARLCGRQSHQAGDDLQQDSRGPHAVRSSLARRGDRILQGARRGSCGRTGSAPEPGEASSPDSG